MADIAEAAGGAAAAAGEVVASDSKDSKRFEVKKWNAVRPSPFCTSLFPPKVNARGRPARGRLHSGGSPPCLQYAAAARRQDRVLRASPEKLGWLPWALSGEADQKYAMWCLH